MSTTAPASFQPSQPSTPPGGSVGPPRENIGAVGWMRENLFSSRFNGALTVVTAVLIVLALWFGGRWTLNSADWSVLTALGGQMMMGQYNTGDACPGRNCFWRPQASLLLVTALLGMVWAVAGGGVAKRSAILVAVVAAAFALLPYSFDRMGLDVRLLLAANIPALFVGYALGRYTPLGKPSRIVMLGVAVFLVTLVLLRGLPGVPGLQPVSVIHWGGLMLNLLLAVAGIVFSLPIGIALALGRRSNLPIVKALCVGFIELFRGVPLITLLFMSQVLVPLAFPSDFPQNSLFRASVIIILFSSAYMAENVRGGLQALPSGQVEAARALGLPGWQTTVFIELPQAIRNVIPAIVGQFIALFKDTTLVYIIGMQDIVERSRSFIKGNPEYLGNAPELFIFLAIVFWIFTFGMSYLSLRLERYLGVGQR